MTKVHRLTVLVIDHDNIGSLGIRTVLEEQRYPNRCIAPSVLSVDSREVDWSDDHPLNQRSSTANAVAHLFGDGQCRGDVHVMRGGYSRDCKCGRVAERR